MTIQEIRIGDKVQDRNGFEFEVVALFKDGTVHCDFDGNEADIWEFKVDELKRVSKETWIAVQCDEHDWRSAYFKQNLNRMNKYRKIPVEVEAFQFTDKTKDRVYAWAQSIQGNVFHDWDENKQPILKIPTLEGEMVCALGDYLIKEPFPTDWRKLYPCKQSIFEQSYEAVI